MKVILHMDDKNDWLDIVLKRKADLQTFLAEPVEILSRVSVPEARAVVEMKDHRMRELAGEGARLDAVIVDLKMSGGTLTDVRNWLRTVRELARGIGKDALKDIDERCPAIPVARLAAEKGATVVILTGADKFLKPEELDVATERKLIMEACGASAYVTKTDARWWENLTKALAGTQA